MNSLRRLPLNVQVLICSFLPRPTAVPRFYASTSPAAARLHATVSLVAPGSEPVDATRPVPHAARPLLSDDGLSQPLSEAVFEDASDEYLNVPLSVLDHPAVPRSPDDSLLSLLEADKPHDARNLLYELRASAQHIPRRYAFFRHARLVAAMPDTDLFLRNEHGERDWLEWWKLAPAITDPVHEEVQDLRGVDKAMAHTAKLLLRNLRGEIALHGSVATPTAGSPRSGDINEAFTLFEEFCLVLCRQGYARVVALEAFPYLTAYAPPAVGERVFATALASLRQQRAAFVAQGAYLSYRRRMARNRTRSVSAAKRSLSSQRVLQMRASTMRIWFVNRCNAALSALALARGAAVLAHANLGRLGTAVDLVEAMSTGEFALAHMKINRSVCLRLLELLAEQDQFALFERTYESLRAGSRRLTRTRSAALRERTPFLIRGSAFDPSDVAPSAREAFLAWRYQTAVTAIEEGPTSPTYGADDMLERLVEDDLRAATGEYGVPLNRDVYSNRSIKLVRLVENDDVAGTRFASSARLIAQILVDGGHVHTGSGRAKRLPSANALAVWILHARQRAQNGDERCGEILVSLALDAHTRSGATRGLWVTATMLAEVKSRRYQAALEAYKSHFDVVALPPRLRRGLWDATHDRRPRAERMRSTPTNAGDDASDDLRQTLPMPPSAYSLALLVQALVPWYADRATTARTALGAAQARLVVAELYDELLTWPSGSLIPSRTRAQRQGTKGEPEDQDSQSASALDPYSFTPFLLDHLRRRAPLAAAQVLADMHERGIEPQAPHYSIVLNAFARGAFKGDSTTQGEHEGTSVPSTTTADLLFLLRLFERRETTTQGGLSVAVQNLVSRLPVPSAEQGPLGVHAYTGILSGLRRRGERGTALEVLKGLMASRVDDIRRWVREDGRFKEEVVLLGKASGISAEGTVQ